MREPLKQTLEERKLKRRTPIASRCLLSALMVWSACTLPAQALSVFAEYPNASSLSADEQQAVTAGVQQGDIAVSGRVFDASGAAVVGAHVSLSFTGKPELLTQVTGTDGGYSITIPGPGPFNVTVTAQGFATYRSSAETVGRAGITLPDIILTIAAVSTQVQVAANSNSIAIEQVHAEEKQRILGVVPNYYVSYNQDTAPLRPKQKFDLAWRFTLDPASFGIAGVIAGVGQANNSYSGYGQGAQGYSKRYAAAYGDFLTGIFISNAILPSLLKQDPRYFYKGTGSKRSRILYAVANSVICRGDNGRWQTNYSNIIGSLASGGISNAYYPAKDRNGAALTFENAGINIGATAAANLVQEFFFKKLTPHVPRDPSIRP